MLFSIAPVFVVSLILALVIVGIIIISLQFVLKITRDKWIDVVIVGSIIVVIGQLICSFSGFVVPILLGPDVSDYNLLCDPGYYTVPYSNTVINYGLPPFNVRVISLHPLQNYTRQVSLTVLAPQGFSYIINMPLIYSGQSTELYITADKSKINASTNSIIVQGIGQDGKKRNCTIIIKMQTLEDIILKRMLEGLQGLERNQTETHNSSGGLIPAH